MTYQMLYAYTATFREITVANRLPFREQQLDGMEGQLPLIRSYRTLDRSTQGRLFMAWSFFLARRGTELKSTMGYAEMRAQMEGQHAVEMAERDRLIAELSASWVPSQQQAAPGFSSLFSWICWWQ